MLKRCWTLCALIALAGSVFAADFGDIPANLTIGAGQGVRRNAGDTLFEAFTPGTGTVTGISAGDLSPLFTTSETGAPTPAITFTLSNAAANTVFGNNTGSSAAPGFQTLVDAQVPNTLTLTAISNLTTNGFVKTGGGIGTLSVDTSTYLTSNQAITLSGDVGGSGTTAITATIANDAVTLAKMANIATDSIIGRATAGTGDPEVLTALPFAFTGDVTRPVDSNAQTIANDAVTLAKIQNATANSKLLGSGSAGSGADYSEITLGSGLTMTGTTLSVSAGGGNVSNVGTPTDGQIAQWDTASTIRGITPTSPIVSDGTANTLSLDVGVDFLFTQAQTVTKNDGNNNAVTQPVSVIHNTTGSPANGLGVGIAFGGETSTTIDTPMGQIDMAYSDITHATRSAYLDFRLVNSGTIGSKMRLFPSGGLSVNSTTDPGAGYVNANTGFKVAGSQIALGDLASISASQLVGRRSGSAGAPEVITLGTNLSMSGTTLNASGGAGSGDVVGPASATDSAIALFDGTTGKLIKNSSVTIDSTPSLVLGTAAFSGIYWGGTDNSIARANSINGLTISAGAGGSLGGFASGQQRFGSGSLLTWSSSSDWQTAADTGFARNAAGVLEINNGTTGQYRDLFARKVFINESGNYFDKDGGSNLRLFQGGGLIATFGSFSPVGITLGADTYPVGWSDVGIVRNSAGVVEINNRTTGQWAQLKAGTRDAGTTTTVDGITIGHQSTGTPAAGFGTGLLFNANDSTTADVNAGRVSVKWTTATHDANVSEMGFWLDNGSTIPGQKATLSGAGVFDALTGFNAAGAEFPIASNGIPNRTGARTWSVKTAPSGAIVGDTDVQTLTNKTIGAGGVALAENASVLLDEALTDGNYTGIVIPGVAGYTQASTAFGDLVQLDSTSARWELVDANSAAAAVGDARTMLGIMLTASTTDGNACSILLQGTVRANSKFPTFTVGAPVYASETAGAVTNTQPTTTDVVIRVIGYGLANTDTLYFFPSGGWITHL